MQQQQFVPDRGEFVNRLADKHRDIISRMTDGAGIGVPKFKVADDYAGPRPATGTAKLQQVMKPPLHNDP